MNDTITDAAPASRVQQLADRVEAGVAWLTTDGLALGLNVSRLCDNLSQLTMQSTDLCVLGLSAPVGKDFHWAHCHLCYEGIGWPVSAVGSENARRLAELEERHSVDADHCRAVALGFDLERYHGHHDWDTLARLWTAALAPLCPDHEDHL